MYYKFFSTFKGYGEPYAIGISTYGSATGDKAIIVSYVDLLAVEIQYYMCAKAKLHHILL